MVDVTSSHPPQYSADRRVRLPFRVLEPTLFSGLFDDPLLWVGIRPTGRAVLVDCGRMHHLAKRALRALDAVFVSHAHMDHFMGFDTLIRHIHVAPRTCRLFGPPGIARRVAHHLAGYDWNLAEPTWCTLLVDEIHAEHIEHWEFSGPQGFRGRYCDRSTRNGETIWRTSHLQVAATLADHKIPVLMLRLSENEGFAINRDKLARLGLQPGPWLEELKKRYCLGAMTAPPIPATTATHAGNPPTIPGGDAAALYAAMRAERTPASIGYLTDIALTPENLERAKAMLSGVTLLAVECSFLAEDAEKSRAAWHLSSTDLNLLARELQPAYLLPMHLSKSYIHRSSDLYRQLELPPTTTLLRLPDYRTPRPLLPAECRYWLK